jgi:1-phosphatidylinositol phosphodiesterase
MLLLMTVCTVGLVIASRALAEDGYLHSDSSNGVDRSDWMAQLPDTLHLDELTLPGTHDSGARFGTDIAETQSMSLDTQLRAGIRAFDIRLGWNSAPCVGPHLWVVHGITCQRQMFSTVLSTFTRFLSDHPREMIVLSIKDDTPDRIADSSSNPQFGRLLAAELNSVAGRIWSVDQAQDDTWNPTLGQIRGKIVLLQRWTPIPDSFRGIPWDSFKTQDDYNQPNNWHLADKWNAVSRQFREANAGPATTGYVNFLSASGGGFPYFFASGKSSPGTDAPQLLTGWTRGVINTCQYSDRCLSEYPEVNCFLSTCSVAFRGVNQLAEDWILNSRPSRLGIVFADFPGPGSTSSPGLIGSLIQVDYHEAHICFRLLRLRICA